MQKQSIIANHHVGGTHRLQIVKQLDLLETAHRLRFPYFCITLWTDNFDAFSRRRLPPGTVYAEGVGARACATLNPTAPIYKTSELVRLTGS